LKCKLNFHRKNKTSHVAARKQQFARRAKTAFSPVGLIGSDLIEATMPSEKIQLSVHYEAKQQQKFRCESKNTHSCPIISARATA